jgi:putative transcriptional regulator
MKNRLQVLRKQRQWSQADLARELGVSRQAVNGFESGKFDPSLEMAFKMASLLDVSLEAMFIYEAKPPMQKLIERLTNYLGWDFGFERFSQGAIDVMKLAHGGAIASAMALGDQSDKPLVEPEHLLLGLLAYPDPMLTSLFQESGLNQQQVPSGLVQAEGKAQLSVPSQFVMEMALQIVRLKGKKTIAPAHLLWGLMRLAEAEGLAGLWQQYAIDRERLNRQLTAVV